MQEEMEFLQKLHSVEIEAIEPQECWSASSRRGLPIQGRGHRNLCKCSWASERLTPRRSAGPRRSRAATVSAESRLASSAANWCAHETLPGSHAASVVQGLGSTSTIKRNRQGVRTSRIDRGRRLGLLYPAPGQGPKLKHMPSQLREKRRGRRAPHDRRPRRVRLIATTFFFATEQAEQQLEPTW